MSATRILRTRSGRELRRIEGNPRKARPSNSTTDQSIQEAENTKEINSITEIQSNTVDKLIDQVENTELIKHPNEPSIIITKPDPILKRKRGRPKNSERELNLQNLNAEGNEIESKNVIEQDEINPDYIESLKRKKEKSEESDEEMIEPPRRKPRMASLNALAKVNAVLECYRFETKKDIQDQIKKIDKKCSEEQEKLMLENGSKKVEESNENVFPEDIEVLSSSIKCEKTEELANDCKQIDIQKTETKLHKEIIKTPMIDKFVQSDLFHKSSQTDALQFPYDKQSKLCTCHKSSNDLFPYYSPPTPHTYLPNFIHIKSCTLAHANAHTLAVPLVKKHIMWKKDCNVLAAATSKLTENASTLVDSCMTNTLMKNSFPCSKLMYLGSYRDKNPVTQDPKVEWKNVNKHASNNLKRRKELSVPCLNYTKISVPSSQYRNNDIKVNNIQKITKKTKGKNGITQKKKCTGWKFEGEAVEEITKVGNETITRKYYQGLKRNEEDFKIHDAVLLKSGLDSAESDYVARISALWEDNEGMYAGDMMMSVFWYYKLEQTSGKVNDANGEKMEVFASRHKDDNSVECIIDRCFVVSFPQFCRFRAQQLIFQENRKKTTSLVPESKNNRSRFIPSPDTDPHVVYFCRYGYDFRCGKIIKNT